MDVEDSQQQNDTQQDLTQGTHQPGTDSGTAPSTSVDPSVNWEERARQYESVLQQLAPHAERIQKYFFDDPEALTFIDNAYENVYKRPQQTSAEIPEDIKPLYDKVSYLENFVRKQEQGVEQQRKAEQQEAFSRDYQYAQRLAAERPDLLEDNGWAISALKGFADQNKLTLEQAWKKVGTRFAKPQKQASPPGSLRADAGEIGIPGRSDTQAASTEMSLRDRLLMEFRKQRTG